MDRSELRSAASFPRVSLFAFDPFTGSERLVDAKRELEAHLQNGVSEVVLDLLGAQDVTTDLLGFLLTCEMECKRNGVHLKVKDISPDLLKAFRFAGLNQVIDLQSTA